MPPPRNHRGSIRTSAIVGIACLSGSAVSAWIAGLQSYGPDTAATTVTISPQLHEMGKIKQGITADIHATIHNGTAEEIRLESVNTSCGCSTPTLESTALRPGETARLSVRITSGLRRGPFSSRVECKYRGATSGSIGELTMHIQGDVQAEYSVAPMSLYFDPDERTWRQQIRVSATETQAFEVRNVTSSHKAFHIGILRPPNSAEYLIDVRLMPGGRTLPTGQHYLVLETTAVMQPTLMIPLRVSSFRAGTAGKPKAVAASLNTN